MVSDKVSPVRPDLPLYYQMVLDEATEGLQDLNKKLKHKKNSNKKKVLKSPPKHKAKKKQVAIENSSKSNDSKYENDKSVGLNVSLSLNKEQSIKEK